MKTYAMIALTGLMCCIFGAGVGAGVWFSMHYRIVPVSETAPRPEALPATAAVPSAINSTPAPPTAPSRSGLFAYKFNPGEKLTYQINTNIAGSGLGNDTDSGIKLDLASTLQLTTDRVNASGTGELCAQFTALDMDGDFMGSPTKLHHGTDGSSFTLNEKPVDGFSAGTNPQMAFFNQSIQIQVTTDGQVSRVSGPAGFEKMFQPFTQFSCPETGTSVHPGMAWTSAFILPLPGMANGIYSVAHNVFTGYAQIQDHHCAIIQQDITSDQKDGILTALTGGTAGPLNLLVPQFHLMGTNLIYFDMENGKLVQTDLNMTFDLALGPMLKPLTDLVGMYTNAFKELDSNKSSAAKNPTASDSQAIRVEIKGSMNLAS